MLTNLPPGRSVRLGLSFMQVAGQACSEALNLGATNSRADFCGRFRDGGAVLAEQPYVAATQQPGARVHRPPLKMGRVSDLSFGLV